jgi:hypothetical protein
MKRFGKYDSQYIGLFDAYKAVNPAFRAPVYVENIYTESSKVPTFPGIKFIKIFLQKAGRGADLIHLGKVIAVDSDDGQGNTIMTAEDSTKMLHITLTGKASQVKVVDDQGRLENEFVTATPIRFDVDKKELTIINIEEL